jgi:hypothetical protein
MVERVSSEGLKEFEGTVERVEFEPATSKDGRSQYKITMNTPASKKSGKFYEWIGLSSTASSDKVPEGSNLDKYLYSLEQVVPSAKNAKTVDEALQIMVGKKFLFKRVKLGKSFKGHDAKEFWLPNKLL